MRSSLFWDVTQREIGSDFPTHPHNLLVPSSRVKQSKQLFLDCMTLEDGTDSFYRNVGNYQPTLRNIPEERRPQK